jgi:hypothetical protein
MLKRPFSSVGAPYLVPATCTCAPAIGVFVALFVTAPVMAPV